MRQSEVRFEAKSKEFDQRTIALQRDFEELCRRAPFLPNVQETFRVQVGDTLCCLDSTGNRICLNFDDPKSDYFRKGISKKDLLLRAVGDGCKTSRLGVGRRKLLDLSAGLGVDAIYFLMAGFEVVALERNPLVYLLLREALSHSKRELMARFHVILSQAFDYIVSQNLNEFDVIYFDPMFPEKVKKSALPRQEIVLFKKIVGEDLDSSLVLGEIRERFRFRLVVKRHPRHEPLLVKPRHSFVGKSIRYDLY